MTSNAYSFELTVEEDYEQEMKEENHCQIETECLSLNKEVLKTSSRVVYPKNSFDRFADDLTELIVSYLWFEDKVRLECVSKQWRRLVFNKQIVIDLKDLCSNDESKKKNSLKSLFRRYYYNDKRGYRYLSISNDFDRQLLESVLKKCPNISQIDNSSNIYTNHFDLISKYCRRITKLITPSYTNGEKMIELVTKHGQWLQELVIMHSWSRPWPNYVKTLLQMCSNIKNIDFGVGFKYVINDLETLKKLRVIKEVNIRENESYILEILVAKYSTSLEATDIALCILSSDELKTCFAHISRFESLESLELNIESIISEELIVECLKLLANKLTKLRELRFKSYNDIISERFLFAFSEFRSLNRLFLDLGNTTKKKEGIVECFKRMTRLKHLSITYRKIPQDFFTNIKTTLPNIRFLDINSYITAESVEPFIE